MFLKKKKKKINVYFSKKCDINFQIKKNNYPSQIPINNENQNNWYMEWNNDEDSFYTFITIFKHIFMEYFTF